MKTKVPPVFGDDFGYQDIRRQENRESAAAHWEMLDAVDRYMSAEVFPRKNRAISAWEDSGAAARPTNGARHAPVNGNSSVRNR
jgi:hypothetical protein